MLNWDGRGRGGSPTGKLCERIQLSPHYDHPAAHWQGVLQAASPLKQDPGLGKIQGCHKIDTPFKKQSTAKRRLQFESPDSEFSVVN